MDKPKMCASCDKRPATRGGYCLPCLSTMRASDTARPTAQAESKGLSSAQDVRDTPKPLLLPKQPAPTTSALSEDVTEKLVAMIRERQAKGVRTYGQPSLYTFNGRNAVQDALEETLDKAQYLLQWSDERLKMIESMERVVLECDKVLKNRGSTPDAKGLAQRIMSATALLLRVVGGLMPGDYKPVTP